jgi:hypothetical protein
VVYNLLSTGIVYIVLGVIQYQIFRITNRINGTVKRNSMLFIAVGGFNVGIYALGLLLPFFAKYGDMIGAISIIVFAILLLLELNKDYRKFRDRQEEFEILAAKVEKQLEEKREEYMRNLRGEK